MTDTNTTHTVIIGAGRHECTSCGEDTHTFFRVCTCGEATVRRCAKCGGEQGAVNRILEHAALHNGAAQVRNE